MSKQPLSLPGEIWSEIEGFSRYAISNYGHIWNLIFGRPMSPTRTHRGHLKISLIGDDGVRHVVTVARLVAEAFVQPPNYLCTDVVLLDGDLMNVSSYNVVWRPPRTAFLYARQLKTAQPSYVHNLAVLNMTTGEKYKNIFEAGTKEGVLFRDIFASCNDPSQQTRVPPFGHKYVILPAFSFKSNT